MARSAPSAARPPALRPPPGVRQDSAPRCWLPCPRGRQRSLCSSTDRSSRLSPAPPSSLLPLKASTLPPASSLQPVEQPPVSSRRCFQPPAAPAGVQTAKRRRPLWRNFRAGCAALEQLPQANRSSHRQSVPARTPRQTLPRKRYSQGAEAMQKKPEALTRAACSRVLPLPRVQRASPGSCSSFTGSALPTLSGLLTYSPHLATSFAHTPWYTPSRFHESGGEDRRNAGTKRRLFRG